MAQTMTFVMSNREKMRNAEDKPADRVQLLGNRGSMADGAHLRRLLSQDGCIEVGAMGIEAATTLGRMARQTIILRMTGHARFQAHAR